ncbi:MAG TPA: TetR/AcrR family transcriptional regulator [Candidatus Hydrogenedentes bacterium]|nr:TetR/AcrR family transcriptional regulator [Candidatus Hydrogenedentota bacterium]
MSVHARKQRELREREDLFLGVARRLLLDKGFHGLTMDRIAEETEYSKGTIYLHFGCKEELILELGKRSRKQRLDLIARGAAFDGRPRERVVAVGVGVELHARLYPDDVRIWEIMNAESIIEKIPAERQPDLKTSDIAVNEILIGLVQEAVACGDLVLRPDDSPQEITFGLWAITDGGFAAILGGAPLDHLGLRDPYAAIFKNCHVLGDGYGWKPLSSEWDYGKTVARIRKEVFEEESILAYGSSSLEG